MPVPAPSILWIGTAPATLPPNCQWQADWQALEEVPADLDGLVLALSEPEQDQALMAIRAHPQLWLLPLFVQGASPLSGHLADGRFGPQRLESLSLFAQRRQSLKLDPNQGLTEKLAAFLWVHPEFELLPRPLPSAPELYDYPLLEAWDPSRQDELMWLAMLERDKVLTSTGLVDRVRYCAQCQSGHLNYLETCPQCSSIDVEPESALHCFTCGHVAAQDQFLRKGRLICPNCLTQLRHIGSDYDRPMENLVCRSCKAHFVDGDVMARCLSCGHSNHPDDLLQRQVFKFKLGDQGVRMARHGHSHGLLAPQLGETVPPQHFHWLLSWTNRLAQRHQLSHLFMAIHCNNLEAYLAEHGELRTFTLIDTLLNRLRNILRSTDVVTAYGQDMLCFLLPLTHEDSTEVLRKKLLEVQDQQQEDGLTFSFLVRDLPEADIGDAPDLWLAQQLNAFNRP
ncbi:diguanylate cyclase domain-containing protein [Gallaecimonas xiamenensis]|uniref:GGDEF domain-containing protein n=1 Tax=Gallaecimonas xiamenensis 3-C-1 TaxID=745411 RepID=K2J7B4_9GAMM|nr:diguanylate cyclase [Gallaecimonas xiamenensis]EKE70998.1 hypothetical protein B3C1_13419 [Gallaecimonas xiamenensis 3-C-1]